MKAIFVLTIFLLIILSFVWRLLSRRQSIPCPTWLGWLVEMDNPFLKVGRAATVVENARIHPGMTVLDAGCGPGRLTIPIASKVGPRGIVVAMDIQNGMLKRTQEKAQTANLANISFLHAGLGENKLEHDKFDRALLVSVLGEIPNQEAALQEIFYALKPGGVLSVTEVVFDPHFQRRNAVLRLANATGFTKKEQFGNWLGFTLNFVKQVDKREQD